MNSSDLSADLVLGELAPAPSVRPVAVPSHQQDSAGQGRERPRREPAHEDDELAGGSDPNPHQIDHLA